MSTRLKKLAVDLPRTRAELEALVTATVEAQTLHEEAIAKRDRARLDADQPFAADIVALNLRIVKNLELIEAWSELHREDFGKARSLKVGVGRIGWRLGNWKTELLAKAKWAGVLESLQALVRRAARVNAGELAMRQSDIAESLIRLKTEPNKDAMVEGRDNLEVKAVLTEIGVTIVQAESFYLEPDREGQADITLTTKA